MSSHELWKSIGIEMVLLSRTVEIALEQSFYKSKARA